MDKKYPFIFLVNRLMRYNWLGNVRELMNAVERGVILCRGEYIAEWSDVTSSPALKSFHILRQGKFQLSVN